MSFPDPHRYDKAVFRTCGNSGLRLPILSLGLWQNFGDQLPIESQAEMIRYAFDKGITYFDLANNYGPPPGEAEARFGQIYTHNLKPYRDELIIATKAGWDMWDGPYGGFSGSIKHIIASLDQSLLRLKLDYVDIFYVHRVDGQTPFDETAQALARLLQQGKALYVGVSNFNGPLTQDMQEKLSAYGLKLVVNQPNYSLLHRWIETDLLSTCDNLGSGCAVFSPLAQGMLTDKFIDQSDPQARLKGGVSPRILNCLKTFQNLAQARQQSLAQFALTFVLSDARVTTAVIGARTLDQLKDCLSIQDFEPLSAEERGLIDQVSMPVSEIFATPAKVGGADLTYGPSAKPAIKA